MAYYFLKMSEKHTYNSEASPQTVAELYLQAADHLETMIDCGLASVEPARVPFQVKVSARIPTLQGRRLHLEYERANEDDDPTAVDQAMPLAFTDETGRNHWYTPIGLRVYEGEKLVHAYDILYAGGDDIAVAYDRESEDYMPEGSLAPISSLDAHELIAHTTWALEQRPSQ